jgi:hypothetical protein
VASDTFVVNEFYGDVSPTDGLRQNESMNTSRIEDAVIVAVGDHWTKVAMVIAKVADAMGRDLPSGDERCEVISEHIEVLIRAGRLEAQRKYERLALQRGQAIRLEDAAGQRSMSDMGIFRQRSPTTPWTGFQASPLIKLEKLDWGSILDNKMQRSRPVRVSWAQ